MNCWKLLLRLISYLNIILFFFMNTIYSQGFYKDIFIDAGVGMSKISSLPAVSALTMTSEFIATENETTQNGVIIQNEHDANGVLLYPDGEPRFKVIYTNGGSSVLHALSLGSEGKDRIRNFYFKGGSYTGSCAGSAIFSSGRDGEAIPDYYQIWPGYIQRIAEGPIQVNLTVAENSPLLNYNDLGGDGFIESVLFNFGNYADLDFVYPSNTEVLLYYNYPALPLHEQIASWAYKFSNTSGRGVVIGCHPEEYTSGERLDLMEGIIQYSLDGLGIPMYKAELSNGSVRNMDKNWEDNSPSYAKIGDRQYHHFKVNLTSESENFTVTLDGADGYQFNLYLRYGDYVSTSNYDYSDMSINSDKSITLPNPESGVWYIAVELNESVEAVIGAEFYSYISNLEVLNGLPYSIEVNWSENTTNLSELTNIPKGYSLYQNYPNPFNPSTTIRYELPEDTFVRIDIYNIQGQLVRSLVNEYRTAGIHHAYWDGRDNTGSKCASGIYIYQLSSSQFCSQKQMALIR